MALPTEAQRPEGSLTDNIVTTGQIIGNNQVGESQARVKVTPDTKDIYPDLYLPFAGNYKISDQFHGYSDSLSTDNNLMILVELKGLSYRYGTSIYAVDRVSTIPIVLPHVRDILEPSSSKQAKAAYLERQNARYE